jgi:hypothetical protein
MIEFQIRIAVIIRECEKAWQELFFYAVALAQAPKLLACFLICHHFFL